MGNEITGTAKQVAWAEDIRADAKREMADFLDNAEKHGAPAEKVTLMREFFPQFVASKTDARWWIDNRATILKTVIDGTFAAISEDGLA